MGTVLPISFKVELSFFFYKHVEPHLACHLFFTKFKYKMCLKHKRRAFMAFEMERSPEKIHLIKLRKKTEGIDLNPPPPSFLRFKS